MLEIYQELINLTSSGKRGVLATIITSKGSAPRKAGAKMLIKEDGTFIGTVGGGGVEKQILEKAAGVMKSGLPVMVHFDMSGTGREAAMICGGQVDIFLEPIHSYETLFLFGAGHISQATATIGKMLGFRIVVIDPRPDYNNQERFAEADLLIVKGYEAAFLDLNITKDDYIIIYTPGHMLDETCLRFALCTEAKYIGMIGSKKKSLEIKRRLVESGMPKEKVETTHTPVGINIAAETPEEIAISILAEIIKFKREGKKPIEIR
jgi:xanthine dehydrogenase accessory factor